MKQLLFSFARNEQRRQDRNKDIWQRKQKHPEDTSRSIAHQKTKRQRKPNDQNDFDPSGLKYLWRHSLFVCFVERRSLKQIEVFFSPNIILRQKEKTKSNRPREKLDKWTIRLIQNGSINFDYDIVDQPKLCNHQRTNVDARNHTKFRNKSIRDSHSKSIQAFYFEGWSIVRRRVPTT